VEKTPIYIFSIFGSKMNEFEGKKLEKTKKFQKQAYPPFENSTTRIAILHTVQCA